MDTKTTEQWIQLAEAMEKHNEGKTLLFTGEYAAGLHYTVGEKGRGKGCHIANILLSFRAIKMYGDRSYIPMLSAFEAGKDKHGIVTEYGVTELWHGLIHIRLDAFLKRNKDGTFAEFLRCNEGLLDKSLVGNITQLAKGNCKTCSKCE